MDQDSLQRQLLMLLLGAMVLSLLAGTLFIGKSDASELPLEAELPDSIAPIEETFALPNQPTLHDLLAALEATLAAHPDAFVPGTRVVAGRAELPRIDGGTAGLTLTLSAWPAAPLMDLTDLRAQVFAGDTLKCALALHAYAQLEAPALVAARALPRGVLLGESDMKLAWVPLRGKQLDAIAQDPARFAGLGLNRALAEGTPIDPRFVMSPTLVRRGELVRVVYIDGGLRLVGSAKALASGVAGQRIELENPGTGRRFAALVSGAGEVTVEV